MKKIYTAICAILMVFALSAQEKAYTPTLVSPENGSVNIMPCVILDWEPISGYYNLSYEVQIANDEAFNDVVYTLPAQLSALDTPPLKFNTTYYWRVRSIDSGTPSVSDWSEPWSYTTFDKLRLISPTAGSTRSPEIAFNWGALDNLAFYGIIKFDVEIDTSANFNSELETIYSFEKESYADATSVSEKIGGLIFGYPYYWRVRAYNTAEGNLADVSSWSDALNFSVVNVNVQNKPEMTGGKNIDVNPNVTISLKTTYSPCTYLYQLDTDPDFTNPIEYNSAKTSYDCDTLPYGTTYHWRAKMLYNGQSSEWTEVWWFSVIGAPILTTPVNNADLYDNEALKLKKIEVTKNYTFEVSTSNTFPESSTKSVVVKQSSSTVISAAISLFGIEDYGTTYYWRAKAYNDKNGETEWSEIRAFVLRPYVGINNYNAAEISVYPNPNNGRFFVELNKTVPQAQVTVMDLTGRIRYNQTINFIENSKQEINVNLSKGLYILKIYSDGIKTNSKFTVL
ncbi:MAG: T9SS type A sorting domain-containing protein [Bacteroidales bacterium]|jgi:hypothetical protein|nr:T9SS type A sorting domain-containing protein [Bacteroidales bacterium]MDD3913123.1 T9SS type A sorting domain-containing protein [Bacteroidales bacterium]